MAVVNEMSDVVITGSRIPTSNDVAIRPVYTVDTTLIRQNGVFHLHGFTCRGVGWQCCYCSDRGRGSPNARRLLNRIRWLRAIDRSAAAKPDRRRTKRHMTTERISGALF